MPAVKDNLSPEVARALARELTLAWPEFPSARFTSRIDEPLSRLELLARVDLIADRLVGSLPTDFSEASAVLLRALDSPEFTGWMTLPCGSFVARAGLDHPVAALPLLAGLTPRFSSEFAVRPFIERHPDITYAHLGRWCSDADEHVRRLVSEGTRPRLPWAPLLRGLVADPRPNIPLLEALAGDPSAYVRRSVANHLNDISRDHPDLAVDLAERWVRRGGAELLWVVRHGLRTLVKRGDPRALALIGVDAASPIELLDLAADRREVGIGETVTLSCTLRLPLGQPACDAVVDYRVHYAGARGTRAPKVFKLARRRLQPGRSVTLRRAHAFKHVSVRRIRSGPHRIDLQVNGRVLGSVDVLVVEDLGTAP